MQKYILKHDTMIETELQRVHSHPIYSRDSKIHSDKRFVNIGNGSLGRSQWTCFILKHKKSYYFDSFGGAPD